VAGGVWDQRCRANFGGARAVWRNSRAREIAGDDSGREFESRFWNGVAGESDDPAADGYARRRTTAVCIQRDRKSDFRQSISRSDAGGGLSREGFRARVRKVKLRRKVSSDSSGDNVRHRFVDESCSDDDAGREIGGRRLRRAARFGREGRAVSAGVGERAEYGVTG
jgi:hypothetical protein